MRNPVPKSALSGNADRHGRFRFPRTPPPPLSTIFFLTRNSRFQIEKKRHEKSLRKRVVHDYFDCYGRTTILRAIGIFRNDLFSKILCVGSRNCIRQNCSDAEIRK